MFFPYYKITFKAVIKKKKRATRTRFFKKNKNRLDVCVSNPRLKFVGLTRPRSRRMGG